MPGPGRREIILSTGLHLAVVAVLLLSTFERRPEIVFEAIALNFVSPPAQEEGVQEELVVPEEIFEQIPDPEPEPDPPPVVIEEEEVPDEEPPPKDETPPPPAPDSVEEKPTETPKSQDPDPTVEEAGNDLDVRMEGLRRDFPAYYIEIQFHIDRCFRWDGNPQLEAVVDFAIRRDGGLQTLPALAQRSGLGSFDATVTRAVECAVTPGRIGPLPEEMEGDELPVRFRFSGRAGGLESLDEAGS